MDIILPVETGATQIEAEAVVVGIHSDEPCEGATASIDDATGGVLSQLVAAKEIGTKNFDLTPLFALSGVTSPHVLVVGLGEKEALDRDVAFRSAATAARQLASKERGRVAFYLGDGWTPELNESAVCGAIVGCQGQDLYRAEKNRYPLHDLVWAGADEATIEAGQILGESINLVRRLVNEPAQELYPESFVQYCRAVAEPCGMEIEVWDRQRLEAGRCGALLAVSRGSHRPPRLVILHYKGGPEGEAPLALVGKGVTFDSGGLSLKSAEGMKPMKGDMAGAATMLGAMQAIAKLKLPVNIIGLAGLVENMPGGDSYKPGDVLTARSGKTIEVLNADAEGRLVLADVLSVALGQGVSRIIDLATLTGACVVALGTSVAGVMTNSQPWCDVVLDAAADCGEPAWQLPMFSQYAKLIKSEVADIKNVGEVRYGGAITAAKFLEEFVGGIPWTHVDIAGPAFLEKAKAWMDGGGTGAFIRTLVEVARRCADWPELPPSEEEE